MFKQKIKYDFCLRLIILIVSIMCNTAQAMTTNNVSRHQMHHLHRTPKRMNFSRSLEAAQNFSCREPQFRSYNLRDLMKTVHSNSEIVDFPLYIVLNRCDVHSGCCKAITKSCTPIESQIYYDEIEIDISSIETTKKKRLWIRVEQHGKCICADTNPDQRRSYSIPNIEMI
ncbi:PREDICTED: uncharacterized protein LOC107063793 [Polistes dominula]|uniref:Uncharacterized protein LOC107063793 n=1 Tax=Polistes dominula TaxID=743375 RepID=A0ABM1HTT3_POLDO|nr:PREDICTED: uncharacterized protein LOC107063793 [Polistes dominula]